MQENPDLSYKMEVVENMDISPPSLNIAAPCRITCTDNYLIINCLNDLYDYIIAMSINLTIQ